MAFASTACTDSGTSDREMAVYEARAMRRRNCSREFWPFSRRSNGLCPASSE